MSSSSMCKNEAKRLAEMGIATAGAQVRFSHGKKNMYFPKAWERAHPSTCVELLFEQHHDGLIMVTGESSDVFVVDIDAPKEKDHERGVGSGLTVWQRLTETNGLAEDTPTQRSGSGGVHVIFSMSKSLSAGLENARNQTKIRVDGRQTTIDTRGDKGCVLVYPTTYDTPSGVRSYQWLIPMKASAELDAMPDWLIRILNSQPGRGERHGPRGCTESAIVPLGATNTHHLVPVVEKVQKCGIARLWQRENGFDYSPQDREILCPNCNQTHTSNQYAARCVLGEIFTLRNYSSGCCKKVYGWAEHPVVRKVVDYPTGDDGWLELLKARERALGMMLGFDGEDFLEFDGVCWCRLNNYAIMRNVRLLGYDVFDTLVAVVATEEYRARERIENTRATVKEEKEFKKLKTQLKQLRAAKGFIQKASNVRSVLDSARQDMFEEALEKGLNTKPDLLAVVNGVIELPTGTLRRGQPDDYLSLRASVAFGGVNLPSPDVDAFMWSVFEDQEVIDYLQVLLGYGITGLVEQELWVVAFGEGANGKGVLNDMLASTLGELYVPMDKDCLIKAGRPVQKGQATPYLAALCHKRMAVCDEVPDGATVDDETVKKATTRGTMTARFLQGNPIEFKPSHLTILLTNHKPKFNCDDPALIRRTLCLPFRFVFKHPHEYDPNVPHHRPIDTGLSAFMMEDERLEQFLAWMVRGAVKYYASGRRLPVPPAIMQQAKEEYIQENDTLGQFIEEYCDVGFGLHVETSALKQAFERFNNATVGSKSLVHRMQARGYKKDRLGGGNRECVFRGLRLNMS